MSPQDRDVPDPSSTGWRRSTRSTANANCVEVAVGSAVVAARDSKDPDGGVLRFARSQWSSFVHRLGACADGSAAASGTGSGPRRSGERQWSGDQLS